MQTKLTQAQVQALQPQVEKARKSVKAEKGTPKFLVRFAVNKAKRRALATGMREQFGLEPKGALWGKAKSQLKLA